MRVLVAVASRHGSTREIAESIGRTLEEAGLDVDVKEVEAVSSLADYDAVVLGSAVYVGHWLGPALTFVEQHGTELSSRPTWLFSSGPLGDPLRPEEDAAVKIDELVAATGAREHRLFAGKLDKDELGFGERTAARLVRAPEGDFRDWDEIAAWARGIAAALGR